MYVCKRQLIHSEWLVSEIHGVFSPSLLLRAAKLRLFVYDYSHTFCKEIFLFFPHLNFSTGYMGQLLCSF